MIFNYSPFNGKKPDQLQTSDLVALNTTHEGWYVEYKTNMVNASAIAKAVSAFANTYGGWVFFGVSEKSKDENVAGAFPGIALDEKDEVRQMVRSSVAAYCQPTPHFELKFLDGEDKLTGLKVGRTVLAVYVPQSVQAPHVHKDGRIYKRVSDSSEPKPETDQHLMAQLWKRRDDAHTIIREWVNRDPELSKSEGEGPYLRVLLTPDDWGQSRSLIQSSSTEIRSIIRGKSSHQFDVPLETTYLTPAGVIGRQTAGGDSYNYRATFETDYYLNSDFILPLRWYNQSSQNLRLYLKEYGTRDKFLEYVKAERTGAIKVMDLNFLYTALISMVSKYRDLMRLAGNETDYFVKIVLINSWRFIPFLDDEDYMRQIGTHGIPMMMQDIVLAPPGNKAGTFFKITEPELQRKEDQGNTKEQSVSAIQALRIAELIFESMGIDVWFDDKGEGERSFIDIKSLFTASERATRNQKVVNQLNRGSS